MEIKLTIGLVKALITLLLSSSVRATIEIPGVGTCPKVNIIRNFDVSRFFGRWYEICAYPNKLTSGGRCVYTTYSWSQENGITLFHKQISFGTEKQLMGTANVISDGVLGINFPAYPKANAYYNILETDYDNYALIFSCNNYYGLVNGQNLWILSRRKVLEQQFIDRAMQVLNQNRLSTSYLKHTEQNCMDRPMS